MRAKPRSARHPWRNEDGGVSIEFAVIGIILIMGTLGVFELGRIAFMHHNLATAIGATNRLIQMQGSDDAIIEKISSRFTPSEQQALTVEIERDVIINGASYIRINARYALPLIMPNFNLFPGRTYTVRALQLIPTT